MEKLFMIFVFVLITNQAVSMKLRPKRQSNDKDADDDRHGLVRDKVFTLQRPGYPKGFPNQGQLLRQGQFPGQGQIPEQGQLPSQGQFFGQEILPSQNQFPAQGQIPAQENVPNQGQSGIQLTTSTAPAMTITVSSTIQSCLRSCSVTSEYKPVCGSNNQTYSNPGRLDCARSCGADVTLFRPSPCPTTTPAPVIVSG